MSSPRNNYLLIVFDSCRYDTFLAARPRHMKKLGRVERRWSYASWTAPSHYNLLMGLMPHLSPKRVYASEYYKTDFLKFNQRLGSSGIEFKSLVPGLYLPPFLQQLGYRTHARVSLPVLNPHTILNCGFDSYKLMPRHNDFSAILSEVKFPGDRPSFYLLNVGETHYPYALAGEPPDLWPKLSGVHGVFKHFDSKTPATKTRLFRAGTRGVAPTPDRGRAVSRRRHGAALRYGSREDVYHHHFGSRRTFWRRGLFRPRANPTSEGSRSAVRRGEDPLRCRGARYSRTWVREPGLPLEDLCSRFCWRSPPTWQRFCSGRFEHAGDSCARGGRFAGRTFENSSSSVSTAWTRA